MLRLAVTTLVHLKCFRRRSGKWQGMEIWYYIDLCKSYAGYECEQYVIRLILAFKMIMCDCRIINYYFCLYHSNRSSSKVVSQSDTRIRQLLKCLIPGITGFFLPVKRTRFPVDHYFPLHRRATGLERTYCYRGQCGLITNRWCCVDYDFRTPLPWAFYFWFNISWLYHS